MNTTAEQQDFYRPRIWFPYWCWEDWRNGIFEPHMRGEKSTLAASLLSSPIEFESTIDEVIANWPVACAQNLTNQNRNKRAFLGQASCLFRHGATERETIQGWWTLSTREREAANFVAEKKIKEYAENLHR